ncbi:hypothetical protein TEA_017764 [Camellia sinensis var. sinensis]|uniref:E1 ubiquitin-activating enzyme n=1 Tax=Camellia sinensis var. sinensis TaxID=542762 RepID=A0A4S4DNT9_CAMSN|nr:hypothetical protein TEA_017764 [Camellia sinensis var. sinensis]
MTLGRYTSVPRKHGCGYEYGTGTSAGTPIRQNSKKVRYDTGTATQKGNQMMDKANNAAQSAKESLQEPVVFTDVNQEQAIEFNDYCHNHGPPIAFIKAEVRRLFGSVFCDFGPEFTVFDVDGEEPHTGILASISNDSPTLVSCVDDERLEFQDRDLVVFSEIRGMTKLNDGKPRKIKSARPYLFILEEDTTNFGSYEKGGDAQKLISIVSDINEGSGDGKLNDINPKLLLYFAFGARAVLNPMAAMFGGIVGQEVVKACSGQFHPIFQFFYFDSVESLPTEPIEPSDFRPLNFRYDAQISVFGSKLRRNWKMLSQAKLTVTDDDVVEKSNLTRQFLFHDWNIGQAKSTVAASVAATINPHLCIEALQNRVGPETENVFDDSFWENLSVVINALDNVNTRLYVDQRCLYFQKPLLKSGTLGAKCNTQMVITHLTENYGASRDPPEKQAPMCTVHSFLQHIDHCLTWARSEFEALLEKTPVNAFLSNPSEYASAMRNALLN